MSLPPLNNIDFVRHSFAEARYCGSSALTNYPFFFLPIILFFYSQTSCIIPVESSIILYLAPIILKSG